MFAVRADFPAIAAMLGRAFAEDPVLTYLFPDAVTRAVRLRRFFAVILRSERDPTLTTLVEGGAAAAIWRPPGGWQTPPLTMLRLAPALIATFATALPRALRMQALMEAHHPKAPHWYLEFVGCDPARQGKGFGGAAIRAGLARADASGLPCALETATESNLALYRAMGFEVAEEFSAAPGLTFWGMWRPATRT